jgi:hypothetical protein
LRLGLQLGRHDDGVVDAYFGPPELAAEVAAEPLRPPAELAAAADDLLGDLGDLGDGWLRDQVGGLRCHAGVLAGEPASYADQVLGCYGVRPRRTDEAVFAAAHDMLDDLLPGSGPLAERHKRWRDSMRVPQPEFEPLAAAVIAEARKQASAIIELPPGEAVTLAMVSDVPWLGYNSYLGDLRGRIDLNAGMPTSAFELLDLVIHETYPGHQSERASKEHLLVRGRGMLEETLVLGPVPQSVVTEGLARLAPRLLLGGPGGAEFAAIVAAAGIEFDLGLALAVEQASEPCRWAEVNAALMLHQDGESEDDVRAYLLRWGLMSEELAAHLVRFITEPASRSYVICYPAGFELCETYVAGQPERFRRLLTEQVRVSDLVS